MPVAIVPAAGASSRFGSMKLLADVEGRPLLECTLQSLLDGRVEHLVLVVAAGHALGTLSLVRDPRVTVVVNPEPSRGMFSSIQVGIDMARHADPLIILPADMPFVPSNVIAALIAEARRTGAVVVPAYAGRRGHPVVVPGRFRRTILDAPPTNSLKEILAVLSGGPLHEVSVEAPGVLRDVDVPEDLTSASGS
jgi:molybdenum cofactor cytidylyltransferase